ncbi:Oidioi.mRNA.OKI2018_I69.chr2.g8428.t3.cds [Oikopleura dioica]|uniref:Oidioi.mRNA.OKI2018_I69.chr2.g8428.t3.cds n=1 Tax=Oikopleura dioica TaxID=34765 RepID=A0ABN7TDM4_OIKDI|nr:Oidioi.mRNA.OKI2018_I69.chr2.g8428.t3.cds [Oikopleura dioica]
MSFVQRQFSVSSQSRESQGRDSLGAMKGFFVIPDETEKSQAKPKKRESKGGGMEEKEWQAEQDGSSSACCVIL